jgi:hypothetical protein
MYITQSLHPISEMDEPEIHPDLGLTFACTNAGIQLSSRGGRGVHWHGGVGGYGLTVTPPPPPPRGVGGVGSPPKFMDGGTDTRTKLESWLGRNVNDNSNINININ